MDISGISNVLKVLRPQADLEKAAEQMQKHPEAAASAIGQLLTCINNAGHAHGIGFTGQNALTAGARLQQFAAQASTPSRSELVELLQYMRPLGDSFRRQLEAPTDDRKRIELLQNMVRMTEQLQRFDGPEKPSDP
ncbi:hypothetical protein [Stenotrophomonas sp. 278]|uniref:hypothetical protein n=1 Tax=Stenotrophomonas sp. 278 TaxID=2479851 RepID=UPI000F681547|nr:hypothetical protein [Stenotrophomonas sp. 278]